MPPCLSLSRRSDFQKQSADSIRLERNRCSSAIAAAQKCTRQAAWPMRGVTRCGMWHHDYDTPAGACRVISTTTVIKVTLSRIDGRVIGARAALVRDDLASSLHSGARIAIRHSLRARPPAAMCQRQITRPWTLESLSPKLATEFLPPQKLQRPSRPRLRLAV